NRDLDLVGINFDRTIEGLARNYLYFAEIGRNVSVDARGILESLRSVYQHDRLVTELTTGEL
ncbi:MAG: S46 family peptidase, partial [Bacteroidota bacterium]